MDTLTHALSGALAARLIARQPRSSFERSFDRTLTPVWQIVMVGTVAATFPDLDFVLGYISEVAWLRGHRGPTHSFVLLPLWALLIAWIMAGLLRQLPGARTKPATSADHDSAPADGRPDWKAFYLVACIGLFIHIVGDLITQFGTMVLSPLSDQRFGWGVTFIIDLGVSGIILAGLVTSAIWRSSRIPAVLASLALIGWISLSALARQDAMAAALAHAEREDITVVSVSASPRPASPFNWTAIVFDGERYHFAHLNTRRSEILTATESDHFIRRFSAPYRPIDQAEWTTWAQFGDDPGSSTLAREVWKADEFAIYRWFAMFPVLDRIETLTDTAGVVQAADGGRPCVSFRDLRFETPGRQHAPFRYGLCENGDGWQLFERVAEGVRWVETNGSPRP